MWLSWVEYISAPFEIKHTSNIYQKVVFGEQQDSLDTQLIVFADKCCCQHVRVAWVFSFVCSAVPADQGAVMLSLKWNILWSDLKSRGSLGLLCKFTLHIAFVLSVYVDCKYLGQQPPLCGGHVHRHVRVTSYATGQHRQEITLKALWEVWVLFFSLQ